MNIGIFTDIHFQPQGLDRIIKTGDWIIEEFKRQDIKAVVCMGDALVTREAVDVVSQSAAINFFRRLADHWPVFLTLGNHDLNLKHSTSVSSLDGLDMHPRIKVFREISLVGDKFLFIPYHEDQSKIVAWVQDYARLNPEKAKEITVFGHLSINGAVQNTRYKTTFSGAVGPDIFAPFKRTYSGHFHVFQRMEHRVTYIGSPLQFNFGDCGDERGIMILDIDTGEDRFITNPNHDAFRIIPVNDLPQDLTVLKDCFVTVIYDDIVTEDQHLIIQERLESAGVIMVRKESVVEKAIRDQVIEVEGSQAASAVDLVEPFVKSILADDGQLDVNTTIAFGKGIITEVNAQYQTANNSGQVFDGDVVEIIIENFLGVGGIRTITIDRLAEGVWYLEGPVGSGKSTILEAIYWTYYGETIRDEMKADDVIYDPDQTGKTKDCCVTIHHKNGWTIQRFRKFSVLGGTGVKVYKDSFYREDFEKGDPKATQKAINDLLGIDKDTYIRAYIMGQNAATNFMTGDEKKRRAMIEEMLGLERFDAYLEKVREYKKTVADQLVQQESIQKLRLGEIERAGSQIASMDIQVIQAEKQHEIRLSSLGQRKVDHQIRVRTERGRLNSAESVAVESSELQRLQWQKAIDHNQTVSGEQEASKAEVSIAQTKISAIEDSISTIQTATATYNRDLMDLGKEDTQIISDIAVAHDRLAGLKIVVDSDEKVRDTIASADLLRSKASIKDQDAAAIGANADSLTGQAGPIKAKADKLAPLTTGGACPTCLTTIDAKVMAQVVGGLAGELVKLRDEYRLLKAKQVATTEEAATLRKQADDTLKDLPTLEQLASAKNTIGMIRDTVLIQLAKRQEGLVARKDEVHRRFNEYKNWNLDEMRTARDGYVNAVKNLLVSYDATAVTKAKELLKSAELANIAAERALAKIREEKSALEASGVATEAAMAQEEQNLLAIDPSSALKQAKERLVTDRQAAFEAMEISKTQAHNLSLKAAYVTFWDKAFAAKGSMRAFLLDQSVKQLNVVVQSYIGQHFDGKLSLTFNADLTYQERYGRRSGGQRRWTDLAALFSLFELARQRSRYRASFLALDEVFDGLDAEGRRAVQDLLATLVTRVKRVFVVTHADVPGSSRAGTIQARMTSTGTEWDIRPV